MCDASKQAVSCERLKKYSRYSFTEVFQDTDTLDSAYSRADLSGMGTPGHPAFISYQ